MRKNKSFIEIRLIDLTFFNLFSSKRICNFAENNFSSLYTIYKHRSY